MIHVTRLSQAPMVLNSDLIEFIESTPDTVITMTTGQKLRVLETAEEIITRVVRFRKAVFCGGFETPAVNPKLTPETDAV
ncbi:MAG: flagellar FlbD family protein [Acidobacteria bacterium]|nr:flagellar FlbD family protein [Acidobacteriota bacterium]